MSQEYSNHFTKLLLYLATFRVVFLFVSIVPIVSSNDCLTANETDKIVNLMKEIPINTQQNLRNTVYTKYHCVLIMYAAIFRDYADNTFLLLKYFSIVYR